MVLLIGNYPADRQQSMQRFATMMLEGLTAAGVQAELVQPQARFGNVTAFGAFATKWLAYLDKFLLFRTCLGRSVTRASLVHICDHSNATYAKWIKHLPVVVTCHDLLAVRGALGEETDCPASTTGKFLQRWILSGLRHATAIACDSRATRRDAERLVRRNNGRPKIEQVTLGLSYPYQPIARAECERRLSAVPQLASDAPFALHVGSNLPRKNRDGALRIFARRAEQWNGMLVFAGDPLNASLRSLGQRLGISSRIIEVPNASNELLEALYNRATALLYPSRFEGFGWPIIEAQACGCPVICSNADPMAEIGGDAALQRDVSDEEGFAADLLRLTNAEERVRWSERSLRNAQRFNRETMIRHYIELYRTLSPQL